MTLTTSCEISVVTPTYNRRARIQRVLEGLARQDFPIDAFEVVVISDGSTDGTNAYLSQAPLPCRVRPIFQSNKGPAAARNAGIREASGTYIVFIDDDAVPEPGCLSEHLKCHRAASRDTAVIGPLLTPLDFKLSPWVSWEQDMLVKQYDAMIAGKWGATARQFYTGNASVRRNLLMDVGGFNESFRRAEDVELAYRLAARGVEFVFTMSAPVRHYAERSYNSWLEAAYAYGKNDAIFGRDLKQEWLIPTVREEFAQRKAALQWLIRLCCSRPHLTKQVTRAMALLTGVTGMLRYPAAERAAYSALFGLQYYQGFVTELGQPDFLARS